MYKYKDDDRIACIGAILFLFFMFLIVIKIDSTEILLVTFFLEHQ